MKAKHILTRFLSVLLLIAAVLYCVSAATDAGSTESFVVYGDSRSGHDTHRRIVARIAGKPHKAVFNTGDLVTYGWSSWQWDTFLKIIKPITKATKGAPDYLAHG